MINLLNVETIPFGALDSKDAAALNRIFNTLLVEEAGLRIQWDDPLLLAKACNIEVSTAASLLKYLTDNNLAYYDESTPGLYLKYQALPDKYRKKLY